MFSIVRYKFLVVSPAAAVDNIVSTMTDCLILLDPQQRIMTTNKAALDLLGYEEKELEKKHVSQCG